MTKTNTNLDMESIGSRLKEIRHHLNLKQKELAEILNMSRQSIFEIEKGVRGRKPSVGFVERITEVYPKVTPMLFFEQIDEPKKDKRP